MEVDGYEFFGEAGDSGGYDWSVFGVCGPSDPADFAGPGSVHDVIRALMGWKNYSYNWEPLLNKLLNYRV